MRIIDGSSYVCSSDLSGLIAGKIVRVARAISKRVHDSNEATSSVVNLSRDIPERVLDGNEVSDLVVTRRCPIAEGVDRGNLQIGSASCRERVWSVRVDLGGRRIIKKKTLNQPN